MLLSDVSARANTSGEKESLSRNLLDRAVERLTRHVASRSSRRSLLGRAGAWATFGALVPTLPVMRASAATPSKPAPKFKAPTPFAAEAQTTDPTACNYWRYCAIDGYLCASCGGGVHSCPPGAQVPPQRLGLERVLTPVMANPTLLRIEIVVGRMRVASPCALAQKVINQVIGRRPITISSGVLAQVR